MLASSMTRWKLGWRLDTFSTRPARDHLRPRTRSRYHSRYCTDSMPRSVVTPVRWVVRTTAPEILVMVAFCRPMANAGKPASQKSMNVGGCCGMVACMRRLSAISVNSAASTAIGGMYLAATPMRRAVSSSTADVTAPAKNATHMKHMNRASVRFPSTTKRPMWVTLPVTCEATAPQTRKATTLV